MASVEKPLKKGGLEVNFQAETQTLYTTWSTSEEMRDDDYKEVVRQYARAVAQYRPKKVLVDARESFFTVNIRLQAWINHEITPTVLAAGVQKIAYAMSADFFTQISLEQLVEDSKKIVSASLSQQFFKEFSEASTWLNPSAK